MNIELRIDRLVIDGVALTPAEQRGLGPAIEAALRDRAMALYAPGGAAVSRSAAPAAGRSCVVYIGEQVAAAVGAHLQAIQTATGSVARGGQGGMRTAARPAGRS